MQLVLTTAVILLIFLNGATDASGAIAGAVSSGALRMRQAALLSALCNTLGGIAGGVWFSSITRAITDAADFGPWGEIGVLASLLAAVLFTFCAWILSLPTSESHALLAGTAGASILLSGHAFPVLLLLPSLFWMSLCLLCGALIGLISGRFSPRSMAPCTTRRLQILCAAFSSFLHGAQDLSKFLALLYSGGIPEHPLLLPLTAAVMGLGTLCGGRKMTAAVGDELASLTPAAALSSDLSSVITLGVLSLLGIPASTTHTRTAAVVGNSVFSPGCTLHRLQLRRFLAVWILSFPLCAALGALLCRALLTFFA